MVHGRVRGGLQGSRLPSRVQTAQAEGKHGFGQGKHWKRSKLAGAGVPGLRVLLPAIWRQCPAVKEVGFEADRACFRSPVKLLSDVASFHSAQSRSTKPRKTSWSCLRVMGPSARQRTETTMSRLTASQGSLSTRRKKMCSSPHFARKSWKANLPGTTGTEKPACLVQSLFLSLLV